MFEMVGLCLLGMHSGQHVCQSVKGQWQKPFLNSCDTSLGLALKPINQHDVEAIRLDKSGWCEQKMGRYDEIGGMECRLKSCTGGECFWIDLYRVWERREIGFHPGESAMSSVTLLLLPPLYPSILLLLTLVL